MGWRDRVKKSFGDFEDIGEGIQNLKNPEKKEKRGLKVTFKRYPQNPQNGPDEGGKSKKPNPDTPRTVKPQNTPEPTPAAIPAPSPAGLGAEYEALWNEAWILADRIDDPDGAPIEERRAKLPALNELVEKMRVIEDKLQSVPPTPWLKKIPGLPDDLIQSPAVWIRTDKPIWIPETCPARCKWSGRCYGIAYFDHKPGKPLDCLGEQCPWME